MSKPMTREELQRKLIIYLRIAREAKHDMDLIPTTDDLANFIDQYAQQVADEAYQDGYNAGRQVARTSSVNKTYGAGA